MSSLDIKSDAELQRAWDFANAAHEEVGQRRKYTNEAYIVHPEAVAGIVSTVAHTKNMLIAALLHDVIEDTNRTYEDIQAEFGTEVADMVGWLSDVSKLEDGNRAVRKEIDRQHTAKAPADVKTIKLGDLIHNSTSILKHDIHFARVYLAEKELLLEVLREGDATLWQKAYALLIKGKQKIAEHDKQRYANEH